ncbi:hypothetical protein [Taibaiella helva]|uniref:hypothetical protein n=1 Tax=Taibaiella helva TaxID=2301235 RepID=UPI000E57E23B|nr:hypothetical protein [Taibaiella helva]
MPIIFDEITALFQGNEAVTQLKAGKVYTLRILYFRITGKVQIIVNGREQYLLYASWTALIEDWAIAGILY